MELDAITVSGATASRAVLFSGMAFVLAMSAYSSFPTPFCAASVSAR